MWAKSAAREAAWAVRRTTDMSRKRGNALQATIAGSAGTERFRR